VFADNDIMAGKNITSKDGTISGRDVKALNEVACRGQQFLRRILCRFRG